MNTPNPKYRDTTGKKVVRIILLTLLTGVVGTAIWGLTMLPWAKIWEVSKMPLIFMGAICGTCVLIFGIVNLVDLIKWAWNIGDK